MIGPARLSSIAAMIALTSCGMDETGSASGPAPISSSTPAPTPTPVVLSQFGFAAIACDHDDPFDNDGKTDYSDEVAGFSNLNQVCLTGQGDIDTARLADTAQSYDPLLYIEPAFFDLGTGAPHPPDVAEALWTSVQQSITGSGVDPARIVFYLSDEPTLRGVALADLEPAATQVRSAYPTSKILLIEAYTATDAPVIPAYVDLWGFNAYTVPDPGAEPLYTDYLDAASAQLRDGQALVILGDGIHTPFHADAGLSETDMAAVAVNYLNLARSRDDVAALLVYTWAGGVDNDQERGVRNLPLAVQDQWRAIGNSIVAD